MPQNAPKILFARAFPDRLRQAIGDGIIGPLESPIAAHLAPEDARAIQVLVTVGILKTPAELMDRLPNLKLICCLGSGYDGVDIDAALQRRIMVTHSPGANAASVADLAVGLLLAANRHLVLADKFVREGSWGKPRAQMQIVRGLEGRRIGIYGFGAIGAKIAARLAGFEVEIAYHSRREKPDVPYAFFSTLQALADWADVLMVAVRADASTRGAVDARIMRALGKEGIVVNISRGTALDETALIELLQSGELGSAGLDVFEHEPMVPAALTAIPQVVLAPHIGGRTMQAYEAMEDMVLANIAAFFKDGTILTPVPEMQPAPGR
jgi:hydroxypyruvate reductase